MNLTISRTTSRAGIARWHPVSLIAGLAVATAVFVGLGRNMDAPPGNRTTAQVAQVSSAALPDKPPSIVYIVNSEAEMAALAQLAHEETPSQPEFVVADSTQPEHYIYRIEDVPSGVQVIDLR